MIWGLRSENIGNMVMFTATTYKKPMVDQLRCASLRSIWANRKKLWFLYELLITGYNTEEGIYATHMEVYAVIIPSSLTCTLNQKNNKYKAASSVFSF